MHSAFKNTSICSWDIFSPHIGKIEGLRLKEAVSSLSALCSQTLYKKPYEMWECVTLEWAYVFYACKSQVHIKGYHTFTAPAHQYFSTATLEWTSFSYLLLYVFLKHFRMLIVIVPLSLSLTTLFDPRISDLLFQDIAQNEQVKILSFLIYLIKRNSISSCRI